MTTAKTMAIFAKTRDAANVQVKDADGQNILHVDGDYVPYGFGIGGGDYLELNIDVETGTVIGWDPEKFKRGVSEWLAQNKEDEDE